MNTIHFLVDIARLSNFYSITIHFLVQLDCRTFTQTKSTTNSHGGEKKCCQVYSEWQHTILTHTFPTSHLNLSLLSSFSLFILAEFMLRFIHLLVTCTSFISIIYGSGSRSYSIYMLCETLIIFYRFFCSFCHLPTLRSNQFLPLRHSALQYVQKLQSLKLDFFITPPNFVGSH